MRKPSSGLTSKTSPTAPAMENSLPMHLHRAQMVQMLKISNQEFHVVK